MADIDLHKIAEELIRDAVDEATDNTQGIGERLYDELGDEAGSEEYEELVDRVQRLMHSAKITIAWKDPETDHA